MTREQLLARFPNASTSFRELNEDHCTLPSPKPESPPVHVTHGEVPTQARSSQRIAIRIISYRRRLLDPDNLCPKAFIDGLRYAGLIPDDSPDQITLQIEQHRAKKQNERTEIEIDYVPTQEPATKGRDTAESLDS